MKINIFLKIFLASYITIISYGIGNAQDNTLFYMRNLPQSVNSNPALQHSCKLFIGLPAVSGIYGDITNTGFTFKDLFTYLPKQDSFMLDRDKLVSKLKDVNYLKTEVNVAILNVGWRWNDTYWTFGLNNKMQVRFDYPKGLFEAVEGYGDHPLTLSGLGFNATDYNELYLGVSKQILPNLRAGVRIKRLYGIGDFSTRKFDLQVTSNPETYNATIKADIDIRSSSPMEVDINNGKDGYPTLDSVDITNPFEDNYNFATNDAFKYGLPKNKGWGIDFGATYEIIPNLTLHASVLDFGYIKWKVNPIQVTSKGQFEFKGINLDDVIKYRDNQDSVDAIMERITDDLLDSVKKSNKVTETKNKYTTSLNTKIYFGANYKLTKWFDAGIFFRAYFYDHKPHTSLTLSANVNSGSRFAFTLSYAMNNRSKNNIGIGMSGKFLLPLPVQFYIIFDQISPLYFAGVDTERSNKWIKNTNNFSIHTGMNLVFGCKQRTDYGLLE